MQLCRSFFIVISLLSGLITASDAYAQQLSYPGGQTLVVQNNGSQHSAEFNHSIRYNISVGGVIRYNDNNDDIFIGPQATWLVKRLNGKSSQANFIMSSSIGNLRSNGADNLSGSIQISADYINTKSFIAYASRATFVNDREAQYRQTLRGGIALHRPRDGKLQPFLALQLDRFDGIRDDWQASPFIRMVKGSVVGEIGVNDKGGILANLVILF